MPSKVSNKLAMSASTGNPVDDFIAGSNNTATNMVPHCRSVLMPLLASVGDIDPSELNDTLTEMMNVTGLPQSVRDELMSRDISGVAKLRAAFRWLDKKAREEEKSGYVVVPTDSDISMGQELSLIHI